jgi:hypothetical protein
MMSAPHRAISYAICGMLLAMLADTASHFRVQPRLHASDPSLSIVSSTAFKLTDTRNRHATPDHQQRQLKGFGDAAAQTCLRLSGGCGGGAGRNSAMDWPRQQHNGMNDRGYRFQYSKGGKGGGEGGGKGGGEGISKWGGKGGGKGRGMGYGSPLIYLLFFYCDNIQLFASGNL